MSLLIAVAAIAFHPSQIDPNIVTWRDYKSGAYSKATDQRTIVMDTLADYQRYVNAFQPMGAGDAHDVDWNKEELVAIHIGTRKTGGYSVEVSTIAKVKPNEAQVSWAELTPVHGVAVSQSETSPWTIVRLNRPGTRITFAGSRREGRLPGGIKIINFRDDDRECTCCAACIRAHKSRLRWTTYSSGADAPAMTGSTIVINSALEYANYIRNYQMGGLGNDPGVDWDRERLLAIHLGRKMTGGFQILIDHIDIVDSRRVDVSYVQVEPTGRIPLPTTATGPYLIVRIPRVGSIVTTSKRVVKETDRYSLDSCNCGCDSCRYCNRRDH